MPPARKRSIGAENEAHTSCKNEQFVDKAVNLICFKYAFKYIKKFALNDLIQ